MDFLSQATNVSNWTLSLILGFTAALQSGAKNGIVGELPICDVLLVAGPGEVSNGLSGDNVVIGFDSPWSKMILRSLYSKRLDFCYLFPKRDKSNEDEFPSCPERTCECHMVVNPMWKRWNDKKFVADAPESHEKEKLAEEGCRKPDDPDDIKPNMFYGLVEDYPPASPKMEDEQETTTEAGKDPIPYRIIHSKKCIETIQIDPRAVEFISKNLLKALTGKTNKEALSICRKIIEAMGQKVLDCESPYRNEWDSRIIKRLYMVMKYPNLSEANKERVPIDEVIDRIHSRIPDMLKRLDITKFTIQGCPLEFTIEDVKLTTIIYFGITRALEFSRRIYEEDALVIMGYNIDVGHELVNDMTEIPTTFTSGFSKKTMLESTNSKRFLDKDVEPNIIFILAIAIDTMLAAGIMILSGLGPILSMFTSRRMTAPYREGYLRMGTTMRWSVKNVSMLHTGTARDDWMVCLQPANNVNRSILGFLVLSSLSSLLCVTLWILPFGHQQIMNSTLLPEGEPLINMFGKLVSALSLAIGTPWVVMSQFVQGYNKTSLMHQLRSTATIHTIINISLVVLLSGLVFSAIELPWVYLYLLEGVYFAQWLFGELTDNWCYESTSLLMVGVLGAVRLCNMPES